MLKLLILGLFLILSLGCVGQSQQSTSIDAPTSAPPEKSGLGEVLEEVKDVVSSPKTIDVNPKYKVLILSDIENSQYYDVTRSKYQNLDIMLEEGVDKKSYESMKESGFVESYQVDYEITDEAFWRQTESTKKILVISNIMSRYKDKESLDKRMDYFEIEGEEDEEVTIMIGREFGDRTIFIGSTNTVNIFDTSVQFTTLGAHVSIENYKIYFQMSGIGDIKLSDLYPYLEILVNRVKSDEKVHPPRSHLSEGPPPTKETGPKAFSNIELINFINDYLYLDEDVPAQISNDMVKVQMARYSEGILEIEYDTWGEGYSDFFIDSAFVASGAVFYFETIDKNRKPIFEEKPNTVIIRGIDEHSSMPEYHEKLEVTLNWMEVIELGSYEMPLEDFKAKVTSYEKGGNYATGNFPSLS